MLHYTLDFLCIYKFLFVVEGMQELINPFQNYTANITPEEVVDFHFPC